ncbi:DUF1707 domain-containing protein [Modestobacter sp. Leaf380]|uniref:DUF1707 SHOCT-like domain-containing protein n=1 Tax=Modestobacter sp. Leaf380 TaxID=1736356 RepID=UPI0006FC49CD|nr:DUF1707 domain-containing protein [Modestobacter sp. Leaf380]KQS72154.1 hypothetical protein ASG41_19045 [Modestobacter sp. Leaf380]
MLPTSELRASDADRALGESWLRRAVGAGRLDLRESDDRARLTWASRTRGELDAVSWTRSAGAPGSWGLGELGPRGAADVVSWLAVCPGTGDLVHPWSVWQLPPGAVPATLHGLGIGRPR